MRKQIYLTFDIETIVTGYSYNPSYWASVYLGAIFIAQELKKRSLNATFYISLSAKARHIRQSDYIECIDMLIESLRAYENIKMEPHIHAFNLPVGFACKEDRFSEYNYSEQVALLQWGKEYFREKGIEVENFRPGGYNVNDSYYEALKEAGYKSSSVLLKDETPNINMLTGNVSESRPFYARNGVLEYPVTSVAIKSIKRGKKEVVNLSPDFFTLESVRSQMDQLNYLNINFHSFSVFLNRMTRENHSGQVGNNIRFFFIERFVNKLLKNFSIETIHTNTLFRAELINWLNYLEKYADCTYFVGAEIDELTQAESQ